ncbi:hypothetical protein ISCGN_013356 [Ixodes scapularis]
MNRADGSRHADEHGTSDNVVDQASPENTALATTTGTTPTILGKEPSILVRSGRGPISLEEGQLQLSRYYCVVSALPPDIADELDDVLTATPPADAYDQLKAAILLRMSESITSRLQRLLTTEELGDQRPSQLLPRMRQLLGEQASDVNNFILRELFLQRLPQVVRVVLAPADYMSLDRLAEMADRVAEYAAPTLAALTEPQSSTTAIQEPQAKVDQLTATVASLQKDAGGQVTPDEVIATDDVTGICIVTDDVISDVTDNVTGISIVIVIITDDVISDVTHDVISDVTDDIIGITPDLGRASRDPPPQVT